MNARTHSSWIATLLACLWIGGGISPARAQENGNSSGINDFWNKPDMDEAEAMLERDYPVLYRYRYAIVAALGLESGSAVADVGAGTGFMARLIAREVGSDGTVYAEDISQESLDYNVKKAREEGLTNVRTVLGDQHTTNLPENSVDLVLTMRTYHHFEDPEEMLASIRKALRPGGRLALIDIGRVRGIATDEDYEHMRGGKGTFTDEILDAGFELQEEIPLLPETHYFLVFQERAGGMP